MALLGKGTFANVIEDLGNEINLDYLSDTFTSVLIRAGRGDAYIHTQEGHGKVELGVMGPQVQKHLSWTLQGRILP